MESFSDIDEFRDKIALACEKMRGARAILVGAGAGLSTAAGLDYSGPEFRRAFRDYIEKYGFSDLYSSSFYDFPTEEERWARWARHVNYARFLPGAFPLYRELYKLVGSLNYFVITTNVDGQFIKAGFAPQKVFEVQGDYGLMQCARGCHPRVYSNRELVAEMVDRTENFAVPADLVPHCPVCGGNMDIHVRKNSHFVEDANWQKAAKAYEGFLAQNLEQPILLLELGVGFNTPDIIRYPFEAIAGHYPGAFLIRVNSGDDACPRALRSRSLVFREDISKVVDALLEGMK